MALQEPGLAELEKEHLIGGTERQNLILSTRLNTHKLPVQRTHTIAYTYSNAQTESQSTL